MSDKSALTKQADWRECVKYHIFVAGRTCFLLDTLQTLMPLAPYSPETGRGKDLHLTRWLREAEELGLITAFEHDRCYSDIGPHI